MQRGAPGTKRQRGFTLVELMAVVVILGILATLGIASFRQYLSASKTAEAVTVMRAIAAAQERYRAEHLTYLDVSNDGTVSDLTRYYPMDAGAIGQARHNWNSPSGKNYDSWRLLGASVVQPVAFGYSTVAGLPGTTPPNTALTVQPVWPTATRPWYVVQSLAIVDGQSTVRVLSSYSNQIAEERK